MDPEVDVVLAGIDYSFNMRKMATASLYIQNGAKFIATNTDRYIIVNKTKKLPGGGTIIKAISTACDTEPVVTGKPNPYVIDAVCT